MIPNQFGFFLDDKACKQREDKKEYFFAIVASSLLKETKYYAQSDQSRDILVNTLNTIADLDPEFILQTAYYVRHKLYIRSVTNFILAFASIHPKTKVFCKKYFCQTVLIPGDLLEVCKFAQIIDLYFKGITNVPQMYQIRKHFKFTKCLQKLVQKKITQFSLYQLGKQCSDSNRKKMLVTYKEFFNVDLKQKKRERRLLKLKAIRDQVNQEGEDVKQQFEIKTAVRTGKAKKNQRAHQQTPVEQINVFDLDFLSMKDVVQFCHVTQPKHLVDSILGRKYPKTEEEAKQRYTDEDVEFALEQAGKRMKIPIPVTWDRELSKGIQSKKQIWEELIQNNQIPYLALLRNLRNILEANISDDLHLKVIQKLQNQKLVENSKTFPLQYFSALSEIDKLKCPKKEKQEPAKRIKKQQKEAAKTQKMEMEQVEQEKYTPPVQILDLYKEAIENALKISCDKNLDTIPGITYVFVDVSGSMSNKISGGKKYGSVQQCMTCAFVLGHMIRIKCETSKFYLFAAPGSAKKDPFLEVEFGNDTLLQGIEKCEKLSKNLSGSHEMVGQTIQDVLLKPKIHADNIVVLSDMMVTQGFSEGNNQITMAQVVKAYVTQVNQNAKFFFMDISSYGQQVSFGDDLKSKNCYIINGMSDNVLKYISLAGILNQIDNVKIFSSNLKEVQPLPKKGKKQQKEQIEAEKQDIQIQQE